MFDMLKLWFMFSETNSLSVKGWTFSLNSTQTHFTAETKHHSEHALPLKATLNPDILNHKCEECCSSLTCHKISQTYCTLKELNLENRTIYRKAKWAQKSFGQKSNELESERSCCYFSHYSADFTDQTSKQLNPQNTLYSAHRVCSRHFTLTAHLSTQLTDLSRCKQPQMNVLLLFQTSQNSVEFSLVSLQHQLWWCFS